MLSREDNQLLTRVGPGTPMGNLFRRFWLPAALASELAEPDGSPVRLRILGEDLLAFRDTAGRVGIVEAYCSHRLAPLYFGRNEKMGIRCPYHGWKFDLTGACVEVPNAPMSEAARQRLAIKGYPAQEAGGLIWIYMGPKDKMPQLPGLEWLNLPSDRVFTARWLQRSNYMQGVEGEIDTTHISFLHSVHAKEKDHTKASSVQLAAADGAPEITLRETPYGFHYGARRKFEGQDLWRITQWLLPMYSLIPRSTTYPFTAGNGRAWVPVDDSNTTSFHYFFRADRPFDDADLQEFSGGKLFPPKRKRVAIRLQQGHTIDTWLPEANIDNDYLMDRELQRTENFTGIYGANDQDRSLQESMPRDEAGVNVVDRTREHLVGSDLAIVTARRRLIELARDLQQGKEPAQPHASELYRVRAISRVCDIASYEEFLKHYGEHMTVPTP